MDLTADEVLFVGYGRSPICWYRAALPAIYMGCDWVGIDDNMNFGTGIIKGGTQQPDYSSYKVIIWQQPRSANARNMVRRLRSQGIKVILDCDDYLQGVRKMKDHDFRNEKTFSKKEMQTWERTMMLSDGLITSTDWLAARYRQFNDNVWVCKNGLDMGRYAKHRAPHPGVNIGWAGATGHFNAFSPVMDALQQIMEEHPETNFISIGQPFADQMMERGIERNRLVAIPWTSIELYPNAMTLFDIALAPARESNWYRAKSQLRHYEAAAVGAATIGSGWLYDEIVDGATGIKVDDDWYGAMKALVTDHDRRRQMQHLSRIEAYEKFDMRVRVNQWVSALNDIANSMGSTSHGDS